MCHGGRLLADFEAGTHRRPEVPDAIAACLTTTVDDQWVVWAHKVATPVGDHLFRPLTGGNPYPADAVAECRRGGDHAAPDPCCSCGFHAVSSSWPEFLPPGPLVLHVALSGRTLAFEWLGGHVLFRAERQTVARVSQIPLKHLPDVPPTDPSGSLSLLRPVTPIGHGPVRLQIPRTGPQRIAVRDDAGFCSLITTDDRDDTAQVAASSERECAPDAVLV
jgi:hypothetical protein